MSASAGSAAQTAITVFLAAGEESGDQLGASLMRALSERLGDQVRFVGVGGAHMAKLGLQSLFPIEELMLHGVVGVIAALPRVRARLHQTVSTALASGANVLVAIDSPDFTLRVARAVKQRNPSVAIIDYAAPTVWAWRSGRARAMARFVDHVLAILPFEPAIFRRLGGPPCTYVGHPLIERLGKLRPSPQERSPPGSGGPLNLLVMPGSRRGEIGRLLKPFGKTVALLAKLRGPFSVLLPAVAHLADDIRDRVRAWPVAPEIVEGEDAKLAAFRRSHAALAASGTATLELALAGVPMVVAYRLELLGRLGKSIVPWGSMMPVKSIVLPNLILADRVVPEFIDGDSSPQNLANALEPLLRDSAERDRQLAAFARLDDIMDIGHGTPSGRAADIVIAAARR